nr:hypothetical protein [Tanacetum cinerariifolium]
MTTSVVNNSVFKGFFKKQKLTGPNFIDWYRKLMIVLSVEDKLDYLEQPILSAPVPAQAGQQVAPEALAAHAAWVKGSNEIVGLMPMTMEPDIQRNLENLGAYEMLHELKTLFAQQAEHELLQTEFDSFLQNDNMHGIGKTVNELHAMLKLHEQTLTKKDLALHGLRRSRKLKPGALSLYMGNDQRTAVEAIGSFNLYPKETMGYSFYYPPENKVLVARNAEFLEIRLITQEASGSLEDLKIIQEEDTHPSINTSSHHEEDDLEIDEPQSDSISIRRSIRTQHASDHMCLYVDAEEHELWDLGKPANYKAALLDPESDKWIDVMNAELQSMKDNKV